MSHRRLWRAAALGSVLLTSSVRYWKQRLRGPLTAEQRAHWMHTSGRAALARLGIELRLEGSPPPHGLVVANHLSYLDIAILSAAMPCCFVSKIEIGSWPFFGALARMGGAIFLNRRSLASANSVAMQMRERFELGVRVVLFPEGTSTDGSRVLRFHSRLIEPAIALRAPITAACVRYAMEGGVGERELCWFGDETFAHHLWKALGAAGFEARVRFGEPRVYADRRTAASETWSEITAMREERLPAAR